MRPSLQALAGAQHGVFLRRQALECGYTDEEIRRLLRRGEWVRVRHGAYAEKSTLDAADETGRARLQVYAVALVVDEPAVFSHGSAALLHRLPTWGSDLSRVHLTRPHLTSGRVVAGVGHHQASLHDSDHTVVDTLACTSLRRTPLDIAREHGFEAGVVVADAALRAGADPDGMRALAEQMRRWPGARDVVPVAEFADAGGESPGESLARIFVVSLGFPVPQTQVVFRDGGFVARVDMVIDQIGLLVEFDGRGKYRRTRDDLDPAIDDANLVWAEKQREDTLRSLGHPMFRLVWADLFGSRRAETARRLWRRAEELGAPTSWPRAS
ncbi:MAG: type IV toxin-antitoxin system AbiEi family antitoxin domain-containing protein [Actinomycetota bacterium]|nr:type IV toxin-antitoxin system AbiEi family antitoxin domain-containing protein [Actinomycetota bacterium]